MQFSSLYFLFLIPVGFALAFMLWVFWRVTKELQEQTPAGNQPMISIRVRDRYSVYAPAPRMRTAEIMMPTVVRVQIPGRNYSATRQFSGPAYAPTLGMGFKQASSSAAPGMSR